VIVAEQFHKAGRGQLHWLNQRVLCGLERQFTSLTLQRNIPGKHTLLPISQRQGKGNVPVFHQIISELKLYFENRVVFCKELYPDYCVTRNLIPGNEDSTTQSISAFASVS
jgi:hypothetical protein